MHITIPQLSLVVLIGPSGSGKSTFARKHFLPTEILSSDYCRGLVSDDENNQAATNDAFELLHYIATKRLAAGRLALVDATSVQREARQPLVALARKYHTLPLGPPQMLPFPTSSARWLRRRIDSQATKRRCWPNSGRNSVRTAENGIVRWDVVTHLCHSPAASSLFSIWTSKSSRKP